jgi:hypothetical protein
MRKYLIIAAAMFITFAVPAKAEMSLKELANADAITKVFGPCGQPCVVNKENDCGVLLMAYNAIAEVKAKHIKIEINSVCASSCMVLAAEARPYVCLGPNALFAYHKTNGGEPMPLPADLKAYVINHGGFPDYGKPMGLMYHTQALNYWPACKA